MLLPLTGIKEGGRWLFQRAPTLGGECYTRMKAKRKGVQINCCFKGHPPLGVNATLDLVIDTLWRNMEFQWAPTLGGVCYESETRSDTAWR